jgi:hypothetical protein
VRSWWFIRKGAWHFRYLIPTGSDPFRHLLTDGQLDGFAWSDDVYEPETHADSRRSRSVHPQSLKPATGVKKSRRD